MNPRGKVPVLQDGDFHIAESMAAIAYIDKKVIEPPLFGRTAKETAQIWRQVLDFDFNVSERMVTQIMTPIFFGKIDESGEDISQCAKVLHGELTTLEKSLEGNPWFVGDTISAADIALYPLLEALIRYATKAVVENLNLGFDHFAMDYPNLERWRQSFKKIPGYHESMPGSFD